MDVKALLAKALRKVAQGIDHRGPGTSLAPRHCPICGYNGDFASFGIDPRPDARCPNCRSLERHRLLKLLFERIDLLPPNASLLHFAPERAVSQFVRPLCSRYVTADLMRDDVDLRIDIEEIDLEDGSFDSLICSHVLEHVDNAAALKELNRILKPDGVAILAVPIVEGWETTYEDPTITDERGRLAHFGQGNHLRHYGRDFRDRVRRAGFGLTEFVVEGADSAKYSITPGMRVFIARKSR